MNSEIRRAQDAYGKAVAAARDPHLSDIARERASAEIVRRRHELDDLLVERVEAFEHVDDDELREARERVARIAFGGATSTGAAELRDALDPGSKTTEYVADCDHRQFISGPNRERRASELYTGDAATTYSSYLFKNALYARVWEHLSDGSAVLEAGCTVVTTPDHLRPIDIPVLSTDATAGQTAELSAATQSYPVFSKVTLNAWRQDGYFLFSEEMRQAAEFDLEGLLGRAAGRALSTQVAALLATGNGTTTASGIDTCTSSTTATSQTAVTANECIETYLDLARPYQKTASFIVSSGLYLQMLQWKDDNGQYLLRTQDGAPDRFIGRPLYVEPQLADPSAGTVPLVVGDFAQGYAARFSPIHFEIDKSGYFKEFVLTARYAIWMDGEIVDAQALRSLTMHA